MKKLFLSFCMIFLTAGFVNQLQAQTTTCTPAQVAACKKICTPTAAANCTPAQKAACQKVCDKSSSAKVASTDASENPFVKVVNSTTPTKSTSCASVKTTKNETPSCNSKKTKLVKNEKTTTTPIAQQVANRPNGTND